MTRIFKSVDYFQPNDPEPIRSVISESSNATIVAWHVNPGQTIAPHIHPNGQDTWTILTGTGQYFMDLFGYHQTIVAGDVVIAPVGAVHGVRNHGDQALTFISVVTPFEAGYQPIELELQL